MVRDTFQSFHRGDGMTNVKYLYRLAELFRIPAHNVANNWCQYCKKYTSERPSTPASPDFFGPHAPNLDVIRFVWARKLSSRCWIKRFGERPLSQVCAVTVQIIAELQRSPYKDEERQDMADIPSA